MDTERNRGSSADASINAASYRSGELASERLAVVAPLGSINNVLVISVVTLHVFGVVVDKCNKARGGFEDVF